MKTVVSLVAVTLLGVAPIAAAQINMPNPQQPGMSPGNAVRLVVPSDLMVDHAIKRWLRKYYPGWDADPHEIQEIGMDRFAVVRINTKDHPSRRVYFKLARHESEDNDDNLPSYP